MEFGEGWSLILSTVLQPRIPVVMMRYALAVSLDINLKFFPQSCPPTRPISSAPPLNGTALNPQPVDIQLPPGWQTAPKTTNSRTTMILAVSLALSLFICFLIIVCLFWRKGLLNKKKMSQDVEAKRRTPNDLENNTSEEHNIEVEKAKALQKIWARASARWKANARYSLRQRRGKRFFTKSHHQSTTSTVDDSRSHLAARTSRQPSVESLPLPNPPLEEGPANQERQGPPSRPSSPPAYHTDHQIPPITTSSPGSISAPSHLSRRPLQPSFYSSNAHPHLPDLDLFPSAHVATDDKTLLARLADFASAPPNETDTVANMPLTQVSAPDDLEFEHSSPTSTQLDHPPSVSLFPPPPSKERLAAAERLEYAFAYDNLENTEPEPEPSAPPFEESSAMPPLHQSMLFPSAPPIIDDDEDRVLYPSAPCLPSAPALEDLSPSRVVSYQENFPEQYHDKQTR